MNLDKELLKKLILEQKSNKKMNLVEQNPAAPAPTTQQPAQPQQPQQQGQGQNLTIQINDNVKKILTPIAQLLKNTGANNADINNILKSLDAVGIKPQ